MVFPREHGLARGRPFEVDVGGELRMKDQAEAQAAIDAERDAARLADATRGKASSCSARMRSRPRVRKCGRRW